MTTQLAIACMHRPSAILVGSLCAVICVTSRAQQIAAPPQPAATPSDIGIQEIVVTAQKRSESVNSVPITIQAVTGADLTNRGITSTADLAKIVPGFTASDPGYGSTIYTLRGVGLNDYGIGSSPSVAVYLDETPLTFPVMVEQQPLDLERVEVLKGPQGTLFGQSATGGAINYVSAKPTQDFSVGGVITYTNFGRTDLSAFVNGPLSETVSARLAVREVSGGAWQYSTTRDDKLGNADVKQARFLTKWNASDALTVNFNLNGYTDNSDIQAPQLITVHPANPALAAPLLLDHPIITGTDRAADWDADWPMDRNDAFGQAALRADYRITPSITLTALGSYQIMHLSHYFEYDATQVPDATSEQYGRIRSQNAEVRITGDMSSINWIAGGSYEHAAIQDDVFSGIPDYTAGQPFPDLPHLTQLITSLPQEITNFGIFGDATLKVTSRMRVYGGARYSDSKHDGSSCNYDGGAANEVGQLIDRLQQVAIAAGLKTTPFVPAYSTTCIALDSNFDPIKVPLSLHQDNVSFRAGSDYTFDNSTLVYGNFRRGFKDGILPILPGFSAAQSVPAVQERLDAWEAGIKAPVFEHRLQLNGAAFFYDYKDKQVLGNIQEPIFGTLTREINVPKSRILGAEAEAVARPIEGWRLSANISYLDSRVLGTFVNYNAAGIQGNLSGSKLPFAPQWSGAADAEYDWATTSTINVFLGTSLKFQSSDNATFSNAAVPGDDFRIAAYTLVDLRAGIRSRNNKWRLSLWVQNLADKYYWTGVVSSVDSTFRYTGMPRTVGITFSMTP